MLFSDIPRKRLILSPTPLEKIERFGNLLNHPSFFIKRDDLIPLGLGGNKIRNLEFWLGEAVANGADLIVVAGAAVSNQCRLAAAAAALTELPCHILHSGEKTDEYSGNSLLNSLMETKRIYLGPVTEEERNAAAHEYISQQARLGKKPYLIGEPVTGSLGYVNAALEIHAQAEQRNLDIRHLYISGSMGPTEAGLLWGSALLGGAFHIHAPSVEYPQADLQKRILNIFDGISQKMQVRPAVSPQKILHVYDDLLGKGYDTDTPESLEALKKLAATEGIFMDCTYNAKVLDFILNHTSPQNLPSGEGACLIHTGGIPALFAQGARFKTLL